MCAMLIWLIVGIFVFLVFVAALYRPLPSGIADSKKIHLLEFLMRLSNEHIGNLLELFAGPVVRNRLTRFIASIPFWLFQQWRKPPKWCLIQTERIAGIKCRMYIPRGAARRSHSALVYIHGGGWCMGKPKFYDGPLLHIVKRLGLAIVSIDYSLSPEAKFPCALQECEKVLEELHMKKFNGIGVDKVALMGDSAGGNLCAVLCQRAMRKHRSSSGNNNMNNVLMPKCQVLVYPVIHMLDFQSPSYRYYYRSYPGTGLLNPTMLIRWYLFYLGIKPSQENIRAMAKNKHLSRDLTEDREFMRLVDRSQLPKELPFQEVRTTDGIKENDGKQFEMVKSTNTTTNKQTCFLTRIYRANNKVADVNIVNEKQTNENDKKFVDQMTQMLRNPDLCPLVADDLYGVCPALICTAGIDILRDEGILYAERLRKFDVPVEWKHYEAAYHGILNMGKSVQRAQILNDICDYLQRNLL